MSSEPRFVAGNRLAPLTVTLLAFPLFAACGGTQAPLQQECLAPSTLEDSAPVVRLGVHLQLGAAPLTLGQEATFSGGGRIKPTKARLFLSQVELVNVEGQRIAAELVDEGGQRLPHGVALLDLERPESLGLPLRAPAGQYRSLSLSVGVPRFCDTGRTLNHSDASTMPPPLDVDSDMYWSWNPGYVFLKFEGQLASGSAWEGFFFHVGEDKRLARVELPFDFTVSQSDSVGPALLVDFERLLTLPTGEAGPDITDPTQRRVHGGALADVLAENLRASGVLRLSPHHP